MPDAGDILKAIKVRWDRGSLDYLAPWVVVGESMCLPDDPPTEEHRAFIEHAKTDIQYLLFLLGEVPGPSPY